MYIVPASVCSLLNLNVSFEFILRRFVVWSENAAHFKRLMKILSNLPILYYGFKPLTKLINEVLFSPRYYCGRRPQCGQSGSTRHVSHHALSPELLQTLGVLLMNTPQEEVHCFYPFVNSKELTTLIQGFLLTKKSANSHTQ